MEKLMKSQAILLLLVCFLACSNKEELPKIDEKKNLGSDSSTLVLGENQVIIDSGFSFSTIFGGSTYTPWNPSTEDMMIAEKLLEGCFKTESKENEKLFRKRTLDDYYRQFICAKNEKGEKIMWINCFCKKPDGAFKDWKTKIISVDGGGNCFFNVKINLDMHFYYELMVNGPI